MALRKKEVLVRPNSPKSFAEAIAWVRSWLNNFQEKDYNKDKNGNYINYYFADVFFAKNKSIYRVFSDACKDRYGLEASDSGLIMFEIINIDSLKAEIETDVSQQTSNAEVEVI